MQAGSHFHPLQRPFLFKTLPYLAQYRHLLLCPFNAVSTARSEVYVFYTKFHLIYLLFVIRFRIER